MLLLGVRLARIPAAIQPRLNVDLRLGTPAEALFLHILVVAVFLLFLVIRLLFLMEAALVLFLLFLFLIQAFWQLRVDLRQLSMTV